MSAIGTKRTYCGAMAMSAFGVRSQVVDATLATKLSTGIRTSKSFEAVLEATGHFSRMRDRIDRKENWLQKVLSE
jgi:hypothetical protein